MAKYQKVKDGIFYNDKYGRIVEHHGYSTRYFWSKQMLDYLRANFATTLNDELAEWLGIPKRTMIRKARELGLQKNTDWLRAINRERIRTAFYAAKRRGFPGSIKAGEHRSPATEFKSGHKPTEAATARRIESVKRWNRRNPEKVRQRLEKAAETRKKNSSLIRAAVLSDSL